MDKYDKPVTTIAIFTNAAKNFKPDAYEYECLGTTNTFLFNTYKIIEQDEAALEHSSNPFAMVVLTVLLALKSKRMTDSDLFNLKFSLAKQLLQHKFSKKKIGDLLIFLQLYVRFADPAYNLNLAYRQAGLTKR